MQFLAPTRLLLTAPPGAVEYGVRGRSAVGDGWLAGAMVEVTLQGTPVEVDSLDAGWVFELATESDAAARIADRRKLRLAAHWCALHEVPERDAALDWSGAPGVDCDDAIGGEGTPLVAEFAAEPFAAALGTSTMAGMRWLSNAFDLRHRLPRVHGLVEELEVPVWKARRVADLTHGLSLEAVGFVDEELAPLLATRGCRPSSG